MMQDPTGKSFRQNKFASGSRLVVVRAPIEERHGYASEFRINETEIHRYARGCLDELRAAFGGERLCGHARSRDWRRRGCSSASASEREPLRIASVCGSGD